MIIYEESWQIMPFFCKRYVLGFEASQQMQYKLPHFFQRTKGPEYPAVSPRFFPEEPGAKASGNTKIAAPKIRDLELLKQQKTGFLVCYCFFWYEGRLVLEWC